MEVIIILACFFGFFFLIWLVVGISQHHQEVLYEEFYQKYAVKTYGEIISYQYKFWRGNEKYACHMIIRIQNQFGYSYECSLVTNHFSAKKYATVKKAEFFCLPDVITRKYNIVEFVKSKCADEIEYYRKPALCTIPLIVIPEDVAFVRNDRIKRSKILLCVFLGFCFVVIYYLIYEHFPMPAVTNIFTKCILLIAVFLSIFTLLVSGYEKNSSRCYASELFHC